MISEVTNVEWEKISMFVLKEICTMMKILLSCLLSRLIAIQYCRIVANNVATVRRN